MPFFLYLRFGTIEGMAEIPFLSVIIPAYNEAKRLPKTLVAVDYYLQSPRFVKILKDNGYAKEAYEILVVNDGSTDTTAAVTTKFQELIKNLRLVDTAENHGKGWVVRKGMLEARGVYRLFTDADNSTSLDQIEKLLPYVKGVVWDSRDPRDARVTSDYDVVIGSRAVKGSIIKTPQPIHRVLFGKLANLLIQIVAVPGIWDTQCGFKILTADAAKEIFSRTLIDRWGFDIEVLALARKLGFKAKEVPIVWMNDLASHVTFGGYLNTFRELAKVRLNLWLRKYKLKSYAKS